MSPASIPLSPNYFDVLLEEGTLGKEHELQGPLRAPALIQDPREKPPCLFWIRKRRIGPSISDALDPRGGGEAKERRVASKPAEGCIGMNQELDN